MADLRPRPSGAHRWMHCPGSVYAESKYPDRASPAALEGTAAHAVAEFCLSHQHLLQAKYDRTHCEGVEVTDEMLEAVQVYLDFIAKHVKSVPLVKMYVETKVIVPDTNLEGTADCVLIQPMGALHIIDYKHGAGVPVYAEGNPQLRIYALGALSLFEQFLPERVLMTIVQPRCFGKREKVDTVETTVSELLAWGRTTLAAAYDLACRDDSPRYAGDWCRFCAARFDCPTRENEAMELAQAFDTLPVASIPPEKLRVILQKKPIVDRFFKDIEERVKRELEAGILESQQVGYKRVCTRTTRSWIDESEAVVALSALGVCPYKQKVLTPAQVEKELKKEGIDTNLDELIERKQSTGLVPITDKRPEIQSLEFGNLENNDE